MNPEVGRLRRAIEAVDDRLVDALAERAALVRELWALKEREGLPRLDAAREEEETARMVALAEARGLDGWAVRELLGRLLGRSFTGSR